MGKKISTGVDELVALIQERNKISFKDAAKQLGVPVSTIEEWGHFLEEENYIKIEYKLATPYLVYTQLTDAGKKAKVKRFAQNKSVFATKIEMASSYFDDLDKHITQIAHVIEGVEHNMDQKLAHIDKDLRELAQAEKQKEALDKQIIDAKEKSSKKIQELERHMGASQKHFEKDYVNLRTELAKDQEALAKSDTFLDRMKSQEDAMRKKMKELNSMAAKMQDDIVSEEEHVKEAATHVRNLKKERDALSKEVEAEHKSLVAIIDQNHKQEKQIESMQKKLYAKIDAEQKKLSAKETEAQVLPSQIQLLLSKKRAMKDILSQIQHAEDDVRKEIKHLQNQALALEKTVGTKNVEKELKQLHEDIEKLTDRKKFFAKKVEELLKAVKL